MIILTSAGPASNRSELETLAWRCVWRNISNRLCSSGALAKCDTSVKKSAPLGTLAPLVLPFAISSEAKITCRFRQVRTNRGFAIRSGMCVHAYHPAASRSAFTCAGNQRPRISSTSSTSMGLTRKSSPPAATRPDAGRVRRGLKKNDRDLADQPVTPNQLSGL